VAINEAMVVKQYEGYVKSIALKYRRFGVPVEDLVQEGLVGLIISARRWRPDGGACLKTYATKLIISHMRRLLSRRHGVKLPLKKGNDPNHKPVVGSMDAPIVLPSGDEVTLHGCIGCDAEQEAQTRAMESREALYEALETLDERERSILDKRFAQDKTLREVSADVGVCIERVRQIEEKAIGRMKKRIRHAA